MTAHPIMAELRAERRARGITQAELARRSGYAHNAVCQWERGERKIFAHALSDIANALGLDLKLDRKTP